MHTFEYHLFPRTGAGITPRNILFCRFQTLYDVCSEELNLNSTTIMRTLTIASLLAVLLIALSSGASAWKVNGLSCPNVTTVDFNWADYLGVWYEIGMF